MRSARFDFKGAVLPGVCRLARLEPVKDYDPTTDLVMVLIAELVRVGVLDTDNLSKMSRRLREADQGELANRVVALPLSPLFDTPEARRREIHAVDGGSDEN